MTQRSRRWDWQSTLVGALAMSTFSQDCAFAQSNIIADDTLGTENSAIIQNFNGLPVEAIVGGTQQGQNLFHSFREFNISEGRGAYFYSPDIAIQTILARVTGGNRSEILGTLGTFGNSQPNLFFINPNGIIFGANAKLDVGGSFVASTANALQFGDRGFFSASAPEVPSLLTVNPSAFLFNQIAAQPLNSIESRASLSVPNGQSLLLLGGRVSPDTASTGGLLVDGGTLLAPGGRIEVGGVTGTGAVGLNRDGNTLSLDFPDDVTRADVSFINRAALDVMAGDGGSIAIHAQNLNVFGGSRIRAGIESGLGSHNSQAGDITLNATGAVTVVASTIENLVETEATGNGGDISVNVGSLSATNGARLQALTRGEGNAGSVSVRAEDTLSFDGVGSNGESSGAFSTVEAGGVGQGGGIDISTRLLRVTDGAVVTASTFGQGDTGRVRILASETISLDGVGSNGEFSGVLSRVEEKAAGKGGEIDIITGSLVVTNGAAVTASTFGQGDAGNVTIRAKDTVIFTGEGREENTSGGFSVVGPEAAGKGGGIDITTNSLLVTNGALLNASTFGQGDAGSVTIRAYDTVLFEGVTSQGEAGGIFSAVALGAVGKGGRIDITTDSLVVTNGAFLAVSTLGQGDAGSVTIRANNTAFSQGMSSDEFLTGVFSTVEAGAEGNGGGIDISTGSLSLTDAFISSASQGTGAAGDISIQTRQNLQSDRSSISATTLSGDGGNIRLRVGELLLLHDNSVISTAAGQAGAGGDGGNLIIDAGFLVAVPVEDSDITANAFEGRGGNINISTRNIFGIEPRPRLTPLSDITASSELGIAGEVTINQLNIDPSQGLAELPSNLVEATRLIDRSCTASSSSTQVSRFVITGRGGLPPNPVDLLSSDAVWVDWAVPNTKTEEGDGVTSDANPPIIPEPIVEARGWVKTPDGQVILVTHVPALAPQPPRVPSPSCNNVWSSRIEGLVEKPLVQADGSN